MVKNKWYVITGGPSSGKSTLIDCLGKLGYKTVPEAARTLIDEAKAKGIAASVLRSDEKRFQEDVARLKGQIESKLDPQEITFFDRGMHDTIAYMDLYGFDIQKWIYAMVKKSKYQKVFLLEQLPSYSQDYARTESHEMALRIQELLNEAYEKYNMTPINVKVAPIEQRLKFILSEIEK